jgi:hypothetical protein
MAIEMPREAAGTADRIDFRSLLRTSSTDHDFNIVFPIGSTTSERWSPRSQASDAIKAIDREIIELFLEMEPRYSRTNRMLAEM